MIHHWLTGCYFAMHGCACCLVSRTCVSLCFCGRTPLCTLYPPLRTSGRNPTTGPFATPASAASQFSEVPSLAIVNILKERGHDIPIHLQHHVCAQDLQHLSVRDMQPLITEVQKGMDDVGAG